MSITRRCGALCHQALKMALGGAARPVAVGDVLAHRPACAAGGRVAEANQPGAERLAAGGVVAEVVAASPSGASGQRAARSRLRTIVSWCRWCLARTWLTSASSCFSDLLMVTLCAERRGPRRAAQTSASTSTERESFHGRLRTSAPARSPRFAHTRRLIFVSEAPLGLEAAAPPPRGRSAKTVASA